MISKDTAGAEIVPKENTNILACENTAFYNYNK